MALSASFLTVSGVLTARDKLGHSHSHKHTMQNHAVAFIVVVNTEPRRLVIVTVSCYTTTAVPISDRQVGINSDGCCGLRIPYIYVPKGTDSDIQPEAPQAVCQNACSS